MNYYRRYMGDYNSKTAALSLAEHGAYNVLLDTCYSTEHPLPASIEALCRICRAMSKIEQAAVKSVADRFFPIGGDGLRHNRRADEEIAKAQLTIAKQRESGVESAAKRWSTDGSTHKSTERSAIQPPTSNLQPLAVNLQTPETALSGKPDPTPRNGKENPALHASAIEILGVLNATAGRNYRPVKANLEMIEARLKDGATPDEMKSVIGKKCAQWLADEKMAEYLRPATLFNRTKFAQYQGELGSGGDWREGMI